jgi:all-trans-retinol 13,14-reductase
MEATAESARSNADVVVVGAGLGGLTAAAYLAAAGRRVVVVEQHDLAGGNSQVFRHRGFEFDVGLHYVGDCGPTGTIPTVLRGLGVADRVTFRELDPDGFDTLVFPEFTFRVPKGWDVYRARFAERFPDEVEAFDRYASTMRAIGSEFAGMLVGAPTPTIDALADTTLGALLDDCGFSRPAKAVLSHLAGTYGEGPATASVIIHALLVTHYATGAYYPEGGGQVLAARLVEVIEGLGGEVRTLTRVEQILVDGGRVHGVRVGGVHSDAVEEIHAPVVVANSDLRRTLLELVGAQHLPGGSAAMAEQASMSLGLVCVYVVVDVDLSSRQPNANILIFDTDDLDAVFAELDRDGRPEHVPFAYLSFASLKDPGNPHLCPPGHTNFQIMTLAPRGYGAFGIDEGPTHGARYRRDATYREAKAWYTERLLDQAERVLGPLRDHIVHVECATPLTQERYTRSTGGTSYGIAHTPAQSGRRRPGFRTEVDGLYLVGASTVALHGIAGAMVGGVACAGEVLGRPLLAEVFLGECLVPPDRLPPFDPADDPVDICRGAALRERRHAHSQTGGAP